MYVIIGSSVCGCGNEEDKGTADITDTAKPETNRGISVSATGGNIITIKNLGNCGTRQINTQGAISFEVTITCGGETHYLSFWNICYAFGNITGFVVKIDGKVYTGGGSLGIG